MNFWKVGLNKNTSKMFYRSRCALRWTDYYTRHKREFSIWKKSVGRETKIFDCKNAWEAQHSTSAAAADMLADNNKILRGADTVKKHFQSWKDTKFGRFKTLCVVCTVVKDFPKILKTMCECELSKTAQMESLTCFSDFLIAESFQMGNKVVAVTEIRNMMMAHIRTLLSDNYCTKSFFFRGARNACGCQSIVCRLDG